MMTSHAFIPVFVSGLALASAFSVVPPSVRIRLDATLVFPQAQELSAPSLSRRTSLPVSTGIPATTAGTDEEEETAASAGTAEIQKSKVNNKEIYLLDEVDSIFEAIDANGDGSISKDELRTHLVEKMGYTSDYTNYLFESIDTDSNGSISPEELRFAFYNFEALSMYMTLGMGGAEVTSREDFQRLMSRMSGTGVYQQYYGADGEEDEDLAGPSKRDKLLLDDLADLVFDIVDEDRSGEITREELKAHFDGVTEKLAGNGEAPATIQQAQEYVQAMFETLDADRNGSICRDEIRAAFQKYDFKLLARTFGWKVYQ